jgi:hypothetical protein
MKLNAFSIFTAFKLFRWQLHGTRFSGCFQEALSGANEILAALAGERLVNDFSTGVIGYAVVGKPVTNANGCQKLGQIVSTSAQIIAKNLLQSGLAKSANTSY